MRQLKLEFISMQFCVLGSGSKGNATYVEADGHGLLIDNGFSGVEIERRLAAVGRSLNQVDAVLITHEHTDHVGGAGVLARKYKIPLYINQPTFAAAAHKIGKIPSVHHFCTGSHFELHAFQIHPFAVSHDTADPVGFVIQNGECSLGYCTDTGMVSRLIQHRLSECNGLIIECNYDPDMLKNGPYPLYVQQRVRSNQGHLANEDAAGFIVDLLHNNLQHVVLAHISQTNNDPSLVYETVRVAVAGSLAYPQFSIGHQDRAGEMIQLSGCSGHGNI